MGSGGRRSRLDTLEIPPYPIDSPCAGVKLTEQSATTETMISVAVSNIDRLGHAR